MSASVDTELTGIWTSFQRLNCEKKRHTHTHCRYRLFVGPSDVSGSKENSRPETCDPDRDLWSQRHLHSRRVEDPVGVSGNLKM